MKTRSWIGGILTVGCALGLAWPRLAPAAVSDEEFNALKEMVRKLNEKVQQMEQGREADRQTHEQDQKLHEQDQKQIQQLMQQMAETQKTAGEAQQKAEAASKVEPVHPVPPGATARHNFTMAGDAEVVFGKTQGQHSGFGLADFAPIFLFRANDNILFEAGFDFTLANNAPGTSGTTYNFDLSFATIDYLLHDYVTLVAGQMLLPLGTYSERSAGWLNKFPDNPLPRGLVPGNGLGAQLRGAIPLGGRGQMITYSVYGANGPSSVDGSGRSDALDLSGNVGFLASTTTKPPPYGMSLYSGTTTFSGLGNLHANPSGGGRLGWFYPLKPHYDLELGLSGQSGEWNDLGQNWSALVVDAALHLGPNVEVKGEYLNTWVDTSDLGTIRPNGWWIQAGYKLAGLGLDWPVINNVELVGRYDTTSDGLAPRTAIDRYTAGFVYYFSNTLWLEGDYEWMRGSGPNAYLVPSSAFLFQLSYGF